MLLLRVCTFLSFAAAAWSGAVTEVSCALDDWADPSRSQAAAGPSYCAFARGGLTMVQATSSVSYTLDGNTFTLFLEAQAQGTWQGSGLPAAMAFGRGTASAETGGLWLYTEQPAIVSFSANPMTFASPTSLAVSSAELRYYFGDFYTTCLNYHCAGPLSGAAPIAPGELLWAGASADILAYGHHAYGFSGAGSSLRLVAQAWAADGSPVPLLLAARPSAFSVQAAGELPASTPEPATAVLAALGLALVAAARRRRGLSAKGSGC